MSSQDFPTYGRGDDNPDEDEQEHRPVVPPAQPYGHGQYAAQPQPGYGQHPQGYNPYARQQSQFGQYGPPQYGQGGHQRFPPLGHHPPGPPAWQQAQQPTGYQRPERAVEPNAQVARLALIGGIVAAFYGLLVLTVQRTALREIAQQPGSDLNHPLRTDVIDTIGQLAVAGLTGVVLALWIRDLAERRKRGKSPVLAELVAFGFIGVGVLFMVIWGLIIASTGFGSIDDTTRRLPTAYGYGGVGLWMVAVGLFLVYRTLRPDVTPVVQAAPGRPPWEQ
jgi:hypothetical protein